MSKHTPGPWRRVFDGDFYQSPWGGIEVAEKRFVYVEGRDADEAEANVSLIVAAPEMLEALERIAEYDERSPQGCIARAAIAKARGQVSP